MSIYPNSKHRLASRKRLPGFAFAAGIAGLAWALQLLPWSQPPGIGYEIPLAAVAVAAIVSGSGGGIIALLVCSAAAFFLPVHSFAAGQKNFFIRFPAFAVLGATICWMSGRARIAMDTLAAVLDSMDAAVVISDRKRQVRFMNRMTQQLTGWTLEETAGKNLSDVLPLKHDETRGVIEHTVADVSTLNDITVSFDDHTLLRSKEGAEIPIEGCYSPIRADGGGTQGVVTVFRNATRYKRARVDRDALLEEFLGCLAKAKPFSGTLPICAWCNKIQDDRGRWYAVEEYIPEHSEAQLATGFCPECANAFGPNLA